MCQFEKHTKLSNKYLSNLDFVWMEIVKKLNQRIKVTKPRYLFYDSSCVLKLFRHNNIGRLQIFTELKL